MNQIFCAHCGDSFIRARKDKRFCRDTCRKLSSQRKCRLENPVNARNDRDARRCQLETFDLAFRMAERLYTMPPSDRLGYLKDIIDIARSGDSARTARVLTMPLLLRPDPTRTGLFWRRSPKAYLTIAQAANRYCLHFWNASVVDVVRGLAPEPPTGEVKVHTSRAA